MGDMSSFNVKMDKDLMLVNFSKINDKLKEHREQGEILLFGGAVMCLVYESRGYTRDVDAIFDPKSSIYDYARQIAVESNLPLDWLNDGVKGFIYAIPEKVIIKEYSNLKIYTATAEYILAMKCYSARLDSSDLEDVQFLAKHLGLTDYNQILDIVEKFIPHDLLEMKTVAFAQRVISDV